jgi:hypothetical protein
MKKVCPNELVLSDAARGAVAKLDFLQIGCGILLHRSQKPVMHSYPDFGPHSS